RRLRQIPGRGVGGGFPTGRHRVRRGDRTVDGRAVDPEQRPHAGTRPQRVPGGGRVGAGGVGGRMATAARLGRTRPAHPRRLLRGGGGGRSVLRPPCTLASSSPVRVARGGRSPKGTSLRGRASACPRPRSRTAAAAATGAARPTA